MFRPLTRGEIFWYTKINLWNKNIECRSECFEYIFELREIWNGMAYDKGPNIMRNVFLQ